jgi:hypothetical protein
MCINLLKRLESSVYSFRITIDRVRALIDARLQILTLMSAARSVSSTHRKSPIPSLTATMPTRTSLKARQKLDIDLADMDYISWREKLVEDADILQLLSLFIKDITPEHDTKLQTFWGLSPRKFNIRSIRATKKCCSFRHFRIQRTTCTKR